MSKQSKPASFIQELDRWTETTIIGPLEDCGDVQFHAELVERVKKSVREKVLESYRNGQAAGPRQQPRGNGGQHGR